MAHSAKALELLSNIDVFSNLDSRDLEALAAIGVTQTHKPGGVVFRQGDKSDHFHIVVSGAFDCYLWDDMLKVERPITVFRRGDIFGEMGLLTDEPRSAFVRATEEGETVWFGKKGFFDLLEKQPKVLLNFSRMLAHRLSAANKARGIKFEQLSSYKITKEIAQLLPLQVILRHKVLPVTRSSSHATMALVDPADQVARNTALQFASKLNITWVCISQADFENFRDKKLFDLVSEVPAQVEEAPLELAYLTDKSGPAIETNSAAARTLDEMIMTAINAAASDLHFEPGPRGVVVRGRIDGRLVDIAPEISLSNYKPIVSRLKVLSNLDITETRLPQDSVLRVRCGARNVDLRISTVPSPHAEAVACRLFDPMARKLDFHSLIVSQPIAEVIRKLFFLPSGLLLVTGPTGSGKTTTLYAGLQLRQAESPTNKIVTAEDPIEYEVPGVTQVQVNLTTGLTFERILRSLLRQDPDVILVGEIRDKSSMDIAFEAALTGHFVLSSLHTNNVFETVMRVRQRGIEPYVVASALRGVISQRLVPRLCSACAEQVSLSQKVLEELAASGILEPGETTKLWQARGCSHCRMTGYKGRLGLYELLVLTDALRAAIEEGATLGEMAQAAPAGSYVPMRRYAKFVLDQGLANPKDLLNLLPATASVSSI